MIIASNTSGFNLRVDVLSVNISASKSVRYLQFISITVKRSSVSYNEEELPKMQSEPSVKLKL